MGNIKLNLHIVDPNYNDNEGFGCNFVMKNRKVGINTLKFLSNIENAKLKIKKNL
jgi:hypothetical protein